MHLFKRTVSVLLVALLLCGVFAAAPISVGAETMQGTYEGTNITWSYDSLTKTMTISGTNHVNMPDNIDKYQSQPWMSGANPPEVEHLVISGDISTIRGFKESPIKDLVINTLDSSISEGFQSCKQLKTVKFCEGKIALGYKAFNYCEALERVEFHQQDLKSIDFHTNSMGYVQHAFSDCPKLNYSNSAGCLFRIGSNYNQYQNNYSNYLKVKNGYMRFKGESVSLNGNVDMNFFVDLLPEEVAKAKVVFEGLDGVLMEQSGANAELATEIDPYCYKFTCDKVAAAEMTTPVKASLYIDGVKEADTAQYTIKEYADKVLSDESIEGNNREQLVNLCNAMLTYGAKAQAVFGVDTANPANAGINYTMPDVTDTDIPSQKTPMKITQDYGLAYIGTSLVYLENTTLRHYYAIVDKDKYEAKKDRLSYTFDGNTVTPKINNGTNVSFEVAGIAPADLGQKHTLTIGDYSCDYAATDYLKLALNSSAITPAEQELAKATYNYHCAAKEYFRTGA